MASHSELVVMRSSGVSLLQISGAVLRAALLMVLVITLFGEFVVPATARYAETLREQAVTGSQTVITPQGTWIRDGENFVRIKEILPEGKLLGIIRYEISKNNELLRVTYAESAEHQPHKNIWEMYNVKQTNLEGEEITTAVMSHSPWQTNIHPRLLNILVEEPESLSMLGLFNYIRYLKANNLRMQEYSLALWKKIWQPIATLVMVFIAIPVIFGPLRSATMGLRLLTGVLLGFSFYVLNQLFGPLSLVYGLPIPLATILPSLIFATGGLLLFRRI